MSNTIIVLFGCIASFVIGYGLCLRSVMYGLRFSQQIQKQKEIKVDNPIKEIIKEHNEAKLTKENMWLLDEWLNGKDDE